MKRSKRKKGSSFIKATPKAQRQDIQLRFPLTEEWNNIIRDFKLNPTQAETLKFTVEEALARGLSNGFMRRWPNGLN